MSLLILIFSMMWLLICKYETFWQEVSIESLLLRWPLGPMDLLFNHQYDTSLYMQPFLILHQGDIYISQFYDR